MNKALEKYNKYNSDNHNQHLQNLYSSQFMLVNDIMKYSPELLSCLAILEWQADLYKYKNDIQLKGDNDLNVLIDDNVNYLLN